MKCIFERIIIAALMMIGATAGNVSADPITYSIMDYAAYQGGYTLSGTITTDGTLGNLASTDITAWSVTFANSGSNVTFTSSGGVLDLEGIVIATGSSIYLPYNAGSLTLYGANGDSVLWDSFGEYRGITDGGNTLAWYDPYSLATPWTIATAVPEPSTLTMLGMSVAALSLYSRLKPLGRKVRAGKGAWTA